MSGGIIENVLVGYLSECIDDYNEECYKVIYNYTRKIDDSSIATDITKKSAILVDRAGDQADVINSAFFGTIGLDQVIINHVGTKENPKDHFILRSPLFSVLIVIMMPATMG